MCLEGQRERNFSQDSWSPGCESDFVTFGLEAGVLSTQTMTLVIKCAYCYKGDWLNSNNEKGGREWKQDLLCPVVNQHTVLYTFDKCNKW